MKSQEYKVGDRITVPILEGVRNKERKGTVLDVGDIFYLVQVDQGYRECIYKNRLENE